jgi:LysR family transcriptional regulator, glycine cleavage system transcriptional activator
MRRHKARCGPSRFRSNRRPHHAGWVPRLGRFHELHPDIDLVINPESRLIDFRSGEADVGIRYGLGRWDDADMVKLSDSVSFPVCSPKLIEAHGDLAPSDLVRYTLLHEERKQWWADWLAEAGVSGVEDWRGPIFQAHLAIDAAEAGQGFALGDQILCTDSLLEGWLARPFSLDMKDHGSYFMVREKGSKESAPARAFREWLMSEIGETQRRFAAIRAQGARRKDPRDAEEKV